MVHKLKKLTATPPGRTAIDVELHLRSYSAEYPCNYFDIIMKCLPHHLI